MKAWGRAHLGVAGMEPPGNEWMDIPRSAALSWGARRAALKLSERRGARLNLGPSSSGTGGASSRKPLHPGVRRHGD